ncbi:NINE protein [Agrococcus sediminis]|uniref:NINE protein n=1 Tax=Agrococcus sediminis TaxID=2599924 RepID=A0A5M8QMK9_9MICO|nr:NINE protein [Agrococcus sediminis]KAA6435966.1 NINE protein [Agrococcus sediminis]
MSTSLPPQGYGASPQQPAPHVPPTGYAPAPGTASAPQYNGAPQYGGAPQFGSAFQPPQKSFLVTWLLSLIIGVLGADRFYLGKIGTGIAKLLTVGGFGIWWLVDLIITLTGNQTDKQRRPLAGYDQHKKVAWIVSAIWVVLSMVFGAINGAATAGRVTDAAPGVTQPVAVEEETEVEPVNAVPEATDEAAPEAEPVEEPAGAGDWASDTFGTFEPLMQEGSGDTLIELPASAGFVTASHNGSANFIVQVLDANNESTGELLVNTIGAYSGQTAFGLNAFGEGARLQVTADGAWSLTIAPLADAPELAPSGSGDGVFLYAGDAGALAITHDGQGNFIVMEHNDSMFSMGLLVNEIGSYSGTVPLSAGPSVVTVMADGAWTLSQQ